MEKIFQYYIMNRENKRIAGPFSSRMHAEECMPPGFGYRIGRFEVTVNVVEVK